MRRFWVVYKNGRRRPVDDEETARRVAKDELGRGAIGFEETGGPVESPAVEDKSFADLARWALK